MQDTTDSSKLLDSVKYPTQPVITDNKPVDPLSPDEIFEFRRQLELQRAALKRKAVRAVPELKVTEEDCDQICECMETGEAYSETFERFRGKMKVTFRVRTKQEDDEIINQLLQDFKDGLLMAEGQYDNRRSIYNVYIQTVGLNGVLLSRPSEKNLRKEVAESPFETMSEPRLFVLLATLQQFEEKVSRMLKRALEDPSFINPDAAS